MNNAYDPLMIILHAKLEQVRAKYCSGHDIKIIATE